MHDGDHPVVQCLVRKARVIAADDAALLKNVEPSGTGGSRKAHLVCKIGIGDAGVRLKRLQNRTIDGIEFRHSKNLRKQNGSRNNPRKIALRQMLFARTFRASGVWICVIQTLRPKRT